MTPNEWISENYENIQQWAKNSAQQNKDWEDLAMYAIQQFLEHPKAHVLVNNGGARFFIVRILLNSSRSKTSQFARLYRPNWTDLPYSYDVEDTDYDPDIDLITENIHGILEDLEHGDVEDWYRSQIFKLCVKQDRPNFSKLSREIGIPRTSISNAYYETIEIVKNRLIEYGINNINIGIIIDELLDTAD